MTTGWNILQPRICSRMYNEKGNVHGNKKNDCPQYVGLNAKLVKKISFNSQNDPMKYGPFVVSFLRMNTLTHETNKSLAYGHGVELGLDPDPK